MKLFLYLLPFLLDIFVSIVLCSNPDQEALYQCQEKFHAFEAAKSIFNSQKHPNIDEEKKLLQLCDEVTLCYQKAKMDHPDSEHASRLVELSENAHKPRCEQHRFNTGEFRKCVVKLNLTKENLKKRIIRSTSNSCQLSNEELLHFKTMVYSSCSEEAAKEMNKVNEAIRNILC